MPDKVNELQSKWDAWNATLVKPLWGNGKSDDDGAEPGAPASQPDSCQDDAIKHAGHDELPHGGRRGRRDVPRGRRRL